MFRNDMGAAQTKLIALELKRNGMLARARERIAARHVGNLMVQRVKSYASGRPGPRRVTGDYVNSIRFEVTQMMGATVASVGSDAPQAARLEFGFDAQDSSGRRFSQPPYPHWRPAASEMEQIWPDLVANAVLGSLK